ncbi:hypothetical protein M493_17000 [Geobacillus genomosp. 3]|uniref:Uncharacterized protein n=1 Tax=Geobacillus genomosp. 3 TaxID=1921421 RepID=S5Z3H6_GEOG3|nr:hypothetical protein [Geobacillus genomosp. 3]AGT33609.1 hypothetical protein M493_17000 [Geobacillus genomosp. 3]
MPEAKPKRKKTKPENPWEKLLKRMEEKLNEREKRQTQRKRDTTRLMSAAPTPLDRQKAP